LISNTRQGTSLFQRERYVYRMLEEYLLHKYPGDVRNRIREQYEISHILDFYGYEKVLERTLKTLDSYSLGCMLKYMVRPGEMKYRWPAWSQPMQEMVHGMVSFNPMNRWDWSQVLRHIEKMLEMHVGFDKEVRTPKASSHLFSKTIHPRKLRGAEKLTPSPKD
jgi:hypothetical protein